MEQLQAAISSGWALGLVLAITRVAGFVVASPLLGRALTVPGRVAITISVGLFLAEAPAVEPTLGFLLSAGLVNAAIGVALGYLSGLIMHLFSVAGGIIDMSSGLAAASIFDPTRGEQGAVFSRAFALVGMVLFYALGGLAILVRGLELSVRAIPLDGSIAPSGELLGLAARLVGRLFLAGVELAAPVLAALFVTELVLGIASRFAPQANIFLVGLPAKILVALVTSSLALMLFPATIDGAMDAVGRTLVDALGALGGG